MSPRPSAKRTLIPLKQAAKSFKNILKRCVLQDAPPVPISSKKQTHSADKPSSLTSSGATKAESPAKETATGATDRNVIPRESIAQINKRIEKLSAEELVLSAQQSGPKIAEIAAALTHLFKTRNYYSAASLARSLNIGSLPLKTRILASRCLLASSYGIEADAMISAIVRDTDLNNTPTPVLRALAEAIAAAGFESDQKVALLQRIASLNSDASADHANTNAHLTWLDFQVRNEHQLGLDPAPYVAKLSGAGVDPKFQIRLIPYLLGYGANNLAYQMLGQLAKEYTLDNFDIFIAILRHAPHWLEEPGFSLPSKADHYKKTILLKVAGEQKSFEPICSRIFDTSLAIHKQRYESMSLLEKDAYFRALLSLDQVDDIIKISEGESFPNTILPLAIAKGFRHLSSGDYRSARQLFLRALRQDPGDKLSSQGLRLALPRTGESMSHILSIRNRIGYGAKSLGRPGSRSGKSEAIGETAFSLMMDGRHIEGIYAKRHAPHWRLLKQRLGDRFLNFERLPAIGSNAGHLFIIADEGVGDEVRTAQFFGEVAKRFQRTTITCDPRLESLFKRSFPTIDFVPIKRHRSAVTKMAASENRIRGFNQSIANYLTENARPYLETSDYVTFGQNIFFNYLIHEIKRPKEGPYIFPHEKYRAPSSAKIRVGLLWKSHFQTSWRKFMHLKIEDFLPLTLRDDIELWSVQHRMTEQEIAFCRDKNIRLIEDIDLFNDFEGLARYLTGLDLIIGVSSLPIELGASLGVPVWMLGFSPENYFLRTNKGATETDIFTLNSTIIAPQWIDFAAPRDECCALVMEEVLRRISILQKKRLS